MKKIIMLLIFIITIFSMVGCKQTKHELNQLAVVSAVGLDITPDNKYMVSIQIINAQNKSANKLKAGSNQNPSAVSVYSMVGDTPIDALNRLSILLGKSLFLGHNKYTLLGKTLSEKGISLFMDAFLRSYGSRPDLHILVTKGNARDILSVVSTGEDTPSNTIYNLVKHQELKGYIPSVSRVDIANALANKTIAPIMAIVELEKENLTSSIFKLEGTAVFKKDRLIGFLDINETRGFNWIKGKVREGSITAYYEDNKPITFDILKSKSKIKPVAKSGDISIDIYIKEEANIIEMDAILDPMKNYKIMDELSKLQNEAIEKEVSLVLYAAQKKLRADIFDFGGAIHRSNPELWKTLEKNWQDIFPYIKVNVKVDSIVKRPGLISKPMK